MKILNLTQHAPTDEQVEAGVVNPGLTSREDLSALLTFDKLPTSSEVRKAAMDIALRAFRERISGICTTHVMIGGAPFLMPHLERTLRDMGFDVMYAFSERESTEQTQPDGSVRKINVFRHVGFVEAAQ